MAALGSLVLGSSLTTAQDSAPIQEAVKPSFEQAAASIQAKLDGSLAELSSLQQSIEAEKIPLAKTLASLEAELAQVRAEASSSSRDLQDSTLGLTNLTSKIAARRTEVEYLIGLLAEYRDEFASGLHAAEDDLYAEAVEAAQLATENDSLSDFEVIEAQSKILGVSIDRLFDAMGGARFEGTAVDPSGMVREGTFVLLGPAGLFRSDDGTMVGTAERPVNSHGAAVIPLPLPEDAEAAGELVASGAGYFPLDPTLGDAHKTAATEVTLRQEFETGGPIMWPILVMAGAALLVALLKWIHLLFFPKAGRRKVRALLEAVSRGDADAARQRVSRIRGPVGRMLSAGVAHMNRPPELVEEVMYEDVLTTRMSAQRFLPFIAICATSAPLLGLLGTVTGIIDTFKLITVYGSGDVNTLSGGISQALLTTKWGLIVAIPSLLLHAFLWRKARGITGRMESVAMSFVNEISRRPATGDHPQAALVDQVSRSSESDLVRRQVSEILGEMLGSGVPNGNGQANGHVQTNGASLS